MLMSQGGIPSGKIEGTSGPFLVFVIRDPPPHHTPRGKAERTPGPILVSVIKVPPPNPNNFVFTSWP